jgi:hypothetical protein
MFGVKTEAFPEQGRTHWWPVHPELTASLATLASFCFTSRGNLLAFPPDCDGCSGSSPSAVGGQSVTSKRPNNETELDNTTQRHPPQWKGLPQDD